MLTKNKTAAIIIQVLIWLLAIVSTAFLLRKTSAGAVLPRTETVFMFIEILIVGLWLFAALFFIHSVWLSGTVMAIVAYVYLWLHRIALPVLVSGLYVLYLIIAGEALLNILAGDRQEDRLKRICHDFIAGAALHISVVGLLSAFGIGGVVTFSNARKLKEVVDFLHNPGKYVKIGAETADGASDFLAVLKNMLNDLTVLIVHTAVPDPFADFPKSEHRCCISGNPR